MNKEEIIIKLTNTEGIMLSDLVARLTSEKENLNIIDEAEEKLLWDIECILEKQTKMIFNKEYKSEVSRIKTEYLKEKKGL